MEREATCQEAARIEPLRPWPEPFLSMPTPRKSCTLLKLKPALQLGQWIRVLAPDQDQNILFSAKIVHPVPATAHHKTAETRFSPSSTKMQQARTLL